MMSSSQNADLEARFGHLLQPIRDLTRNWDVDIARYLEEYLEDLEHVVVTFNCGETTMNFAEAALLVQGSACVYSKKVEYLYSLVYQVMDMIVNKKKLAKSSVDAEGNDEDAEFPEEEKEEFLSLDDAKEAKAEKLQNKDDPEKESHVNPLTPMNLIPQEEGEKGAGEISNVRGEVLGNVADFQMNCSAVQPHGGVFLDNNLLPLLHSRLRLLASSTPFPRTDGAPHPLEKSGDINSLHQDDPPPVPADISMGDGGDMGFEPMDSEENNQHQEEIVVNQRPERRKVQFAAPPKPAIDHWALCDPFSKGTLQERKLKVGQTFKVPPSAGPTTNKKRRRKVAEKKTPVVPISKFVQTAMYSHKPKFPKNPALVPTFPEFEDLFWKEFKRRQEVKRQKQKQLALQDLYEPETELGGEEENAEVDDNWPAAEGEEGEDEGEVPFEPLQLDLDQQTLGPIEACGGSFINSLGSSTSTTYEDVVRQHVENFLAQASQFAQISELSRRVAEWEEKINPRLLEEEQRESFDIHKYGTRIIDSLQRNQRIPFRRIVAGKPLFQICRLFLATLQLANTYNIELWCPGQLEEAMDKLEVKLLNTKRHYEELADYQAPSVTSQ